ncbi:unnamed protein product [Symbiodinium sp. CCMP2592]|nr:unnamed protein product [Symbiodinium sp. CCMP2592]
MRPAPYPAFRWHWKDVLSYKWKQPQHINVLELTAFLAELRRRTRDLTQHNHRFFCIVDSLVTFYVLGKGRSSSKRLNRICRRVTALTLASGVLPISLWTISKWNFSDGALPRSMADLDDELAEYINHLYQEGDNVTQAGWTVSGLKRFLPRCRPHLQTAQLFLRNWHRVHLPQRTSPLPWLGAKAMAAAAARIGRFDLALLVLIGFSFFLRTMELLSLRSVHIRLFPQDGTVVIAILNAKTAKGLQQSLSLHEESLVAILQFLMDRARPSDYLYSFSVATFRHEFACLVKAVGLSPESYLPYCLRRGGATAFYQRFGLGRTVVQGRWKDATTARIYVDDARATLIQLLLPAPVTALQQHLASFWRVALPGN